MESIILEVSVPKKYTFHQLLYELYFKDEIKIAGDVKDIDTIFRLNKDLVTKYERIKKRIINDIYRFIIEEKDREINDLLNSVNNMIDK